MTRFLEQGFDRYAPPLIPAVLILLVTSLASVGYVFFVGFRAGPMP